MIMAGRKQRAKETERKGPLTRHGCRGPVLLPGSLSPPLVSTTYLSIQLCTHHWVTPDEVSIFAIRSPLQESLDLLKLTVTINRHIIIP